MADTMTAEPQAETHSFQAETKALLNLVINSLYTHKEVFLRELVSNASDALDKARLRSLTEHDLLGDDQTFELWLTPDKEQKTLTISDNGVGMTRDELRENLGTIAKSGSAEFARALSGDAKKDANLIGQFGVGFYSGFLVADRVKVVSRAAATEEAWAWTSDAQGTFELEPATRERRGTDIVLHLKDDQLEYLEPYQLKSLVRKYSDFVGYPIKLVVETTEGETTEGEGEEQKTAKSTEVINQGKALWTRSKADVTKEQYEEFYKHVSHDWEEPLAWSHFTIEGTQLFTGLLFVPKRPPFDLFQREQRSGVRLYVKRVFVMEDCDALLPDYLRFVRGVIDSDDLPLNVSREVLQQDRLTAQIRKQVTKKVLELLDELASERAEDYTTFWEGYGKVVKEGLHLDPSNKDRLAKLLRFKSTTQEGWTSLADYVGRMPEGQSSIYFISGPDEEFLAKSPHIEGLKKKGYEVLYFTDAVDEWVAMALTEFEGKPLVSAMKGELDLDGEGEEKKEEAEDSLTKTVQELLKDRVKAVRYTDRLTDSPVCLVSEAHDPGANLERLLRAANQDLPQGGQRILELNRTHPLVENLRRLASAEGADAERAQKLKDWSELLRDQALLTEGSPIDDPSAFAQRMNALLLDASGRAAPPTAAADEGASEG